jgi:hypothetical protein
MPKFDRFEKVRIIEPKRDFEVYIIKDVKKVRKGE